MLDDDNHRMERGERYAVCDKTYNLYRKAPYQEFFEFVDPLADIPLTEAKPFDCFAHSARHPKETKGQDYKRDHRSKQQMLRRRELLTERRHHPAVLHEPFFGTSVSARILAFRWTYSFHAPS